MRKQAEGPVAGDSMRLRFDIGRIHHGFGNQINDLAVTGNGMGSGSTPAARGPPGSTAK